MGGKSSLPGRGRKPKPAAQKELAGNPGHRKINDESPSFDLIEGVDAPDWLSDLARAMWDTIAPQLCHQKVLAATDLHNLEAFCTAYGRWRLAESEVVKGGITVIDGNGTLKKNPACTVANESMRQMVTFGSLLGLDPASRQRLISPTAKRTNRFAALFNS